MNETHFNLQLAMWKSERKISYRPANANIYDVLNLPSTHVRVALSVAAEISLAFG